MNTTIDSNIHKGWEEVLWDGNPSLGIKSYKKKFLGGSVSILIDKFKTIVYDYGNNSERSLSGSRFIGGGYPDLSIEEAMDLVEKGRGHYFANLTKQAQNLAKAKFIWQELGHIPVNGLDEIDVDFNPEPEEIFFSAGTDKLEIWHFIEEHFNISIAKHLLNYGKE